VLVIIFDLPNGLLAKLDGLCLFKFDFSKLKVKWIT